MRVYAENPDEGFLPSPGLITHLTRASGPGMRDDSGAFAGWTVPTAYDPLMSKVIAWAPDRPGAIARMVRALTEYDLRGIGTTIEFCRELIESPAFAAGDFDTTSVDRLLEAADSSCRRRTTREEEIAAIAAALWEMRKRRREAVFADDRRIRPSPVSLWAQRGAPREPAVNFDVAVNGRPWKVAIEAAEAARRFTVVREGQERASLTRRGSTRTRCR